MQLTQIAIYYTVQAILTTVRKASDGKEIEEDVVKISDFNFIKIFDRRGRS